MSTLADLDLDLVRERVDHGDTNSVQPTGDGIAGAAELAAGVQLGQYDLDGRLALPDHDVRRDAAAVVHHLDPAVRLQGDLDVVGVAGQCLIDGVVDDLPDQVVQTALTGGADIHAGALAHCLETLEDCDGTRVVGGPSGLSAFAVDGTGASFSASGTFSGLTSDTVLLRR